MRMRPLSTWRPSRASVAGSTVSEPSMATPVTMIVPIAFEVPVLSPVRNWPAIAAITVKPEIRIVRPDVDDAIAIADRSSWPFARSSRSRRR